MTSPGRMPIAVIGLSGRFLDALTEDRFWENLAAGREAIRRVDEAMIEARRDPSGALPESYVPMGSFLEDTEGFDDNGGGTGGSTGGTTGASFDALPSATDGRPNTFPPTARGAAPDNGVWVQRQRRLGARRRPAD